MAAGSSRSSGGRTSAQDGTLKIITWNVNGLRVKSRRKKIISFLETTLRADIYYIQETHLTEDESKCLSGKYETYCSPCNSKKQCGVAIMIKKNILKVISETADSEGRYLIIKGLHNGTLLTLVNVYGPSKDDEPMFWKDLFLNLESSKNVIIGGDFNAVMDASKDYINGKPRKKRSTKVLQDYTQIYGLCDIWRKKNPKAREYTCRSSSRVDFFLIHNSLEPCVTENNILTYLSDTCHSDHVSVSLIIQFPMYQDNITQNIQLQQGTALANSGIIWTKKYSSNMHKVRSKNMYFSMSRPMHLVSAWEWNPFMYWHMQTSCEWPRVVPHLYISTQ